MAYFKLKRPHSPHTSNDAIGISNYKRARLIEDFERLSLGDGVAKYDQEAYIKDIGSPVTKVVPARINLPKSVRNKLIREELNHVDTDHATTDEIIYSKLREWLREESLQMTVWMDWKRVLYQMWLRWFQETWWSWGNQNQPLLGNLTAFDNEGDYDIDNPSLHLFDEGNTLNPPFNGNMDTDVDMDS